MGVAGVGDIDARRAQPSAKSVEAMNYAPVNACWSENTGCALTRHAP